MLLFSHLIRLYPLGFIKPTLPYVFSINIITQEDQRIFLQKYHGILADFLLFKEAAQKYPKFRPKLKKVPKIKFRA